MPWAAVPVTVREGKSLMSAPFEGRGCALGSCAGSAGAGDHPGRVSAGGAAGAAGAAARGSTHSRTRARALPARLVLLTGETFFLSLTLPWF